MAAKVIAVKQEGTSPAAEGVLARFAEVKAIRSPRDARALATQHAEIVLVDLAMPGVDGTKVVDELRNQPGHAPLILLADFSSPPGKFLSQLGQLARLRTLPGSRQLSIPRLLRTLGVSQEVLSRILNVSLRTVHRWTKRATLPRGKPELEPLERLVHLLELTLPGAEAVRTYLHHPNPSFSGEKPISLLVRGEFSRLEADLQAIQEGVYV